MRAVSRTIAVLLLALCGLLASRAADAEAPNGAPAVRLHDASLEEVRQLAVDSAMRRGWSVVSSGPGGATLEQTLETTVLGLDHPADILVRVQADFVSDQGDTIVRVQAMQVDSPGTPAERTSDVTERYRGNLMNALRSLQGRWASRFTVPEPPPAPAPPPAPVAHDPEPPRLGTWAYYAERYAEAHGCRLGDQGAVLVRAGVDTELHRVGCRGGGSLLVRCHLGDCAAAH